MKCTNFILNFENQNFIFQNNNFQMLNSLKSFIPLNYGIINPHINFQYLNLLYQNLFLNPIIKENENNFEKFQKNQIGEIEHNNNILIGKKKKRTVRINTECPHKFSQHYAKGMCSNCYHSKGRNKKPWNCPHLSKSHYALGVCQNCYQMDYIKKQGNIEQKKFIFRKIENGN